MEFKITDSIYVGNRNNDEFGVFFYDKKINHTISDNDYGIRSYKFKLILQLDYKEKNYKKELPFEILNFIATLDLKDYSKITKSYELKSKNKTYKFPSRKVIDYDKIVKDFYNKDLIFLKKHLKRKVLNKTRTKNIVTNKFDECQQVEFLEFDSSSDSWAGPFIHNNIKGCYIEFNKNSFYRRIDSEDYSFLNLLSEHDFPYYLINKNPSKYKMYNKTKNEKQQILDELSEEDLFYTFNQTRKKIDEYLLGNYKYYIRLFGTDNTSYYKGFHSENQMLIEVQRLRNNQPLNMFLDVQPYYSYF